MKKLRLMITFLLSVLMVVLTASCTTERKRLERISAVSAEVSYGYNAISSFNLTKNGVVYDFDEMARKIIRKKCRRSYMKKLIGDNFYFLYEYDQHGKTYKSEEGKTVNGFTFDVALFCVNVETLDCELIYDFKGVYPTYNYTYTEQFLGFIPDSARMIVQYNGCIQILDLQSKRIIYSVEVYDKEQYRSCEFFPFGFNGYGDYEVLDGDKLKYYELVGNSYVLHEYDVNPDSVYVERINDYVYTCYYNVPTEYYNCFDIKTDESVPIETLLAELENSRKEEVSSGADFSLAVKGKTYYYNPQAWEEKLEIFDENNSPVVTLSHDYMLANNQAFERLCGLWTGREGEFFYVSFFDVVEDRLIIGFQARFGWGNHTPTYLFEYDFETEKTYYIGFSRSTFIQLRIYE